MSKEKNIYLPGGYVMQVHHYRDGTKHYRLAVAETNEQLGFIAAKHAVKFAKAMCTGLADNEKYDD